MPIRIPDNLPARKVLESENIFVMPADRARHQDIRPLRIAVVNLMPTKITTETQLLRLLANSSLQVEITLVRMCSHESRNTPGEHLEAFYVSSDEAMTQRFDGLIITGAPVETLPFEDVDYWEELVRIMDWSARSVWSTFYICWGAQAGLYHHYGVEKRLLPEKLSGLYRHTILTPFEPITRGFDDVFFAPHSRYTGVDVREVSRICELKILSVSDEAGLYLAISSDGRRIFVTGHPEYDKLTLKAEYDRDIAKGMDIKPPANYFPEDDPGRDPPMVWRGHAHLLYSNWLNYCVYQSTPFDLGTLPKIAGD